MHGCSISRHPSTDERDAEGGGDPTTPSLPPSASETQLPRKIGKPWGHELLWALGAYYAAKILSIEPGRRLSLQAHRTRDETLLLVRGRLKLDLEEANGTMKCHEVLAGSAFHVPPGRKHRLSALEPCEVFEVSTPELDDLIRLQDDYGRE